VVFALTWPRRSCPSTWSIRVVSSSGQVGTHVLKRHGAHVNQQPGISPRELRQGGIEQAE
jgi:hypothetical protein